MKKKIIIESSDDIEIKEVKKNVSKNNYHKLVNNQFIEWLIYMIGYSLVLVIVSFLFKSFSLNLSHLGIYAFLSSIIIYILNQTIKPIINYITLPLTILSWGLMYPISNVIILYITSFILGKDNFYIKNFFIAFFISIMISILNILMEGLIIKPIIKKGKNDE